MLALDIETMGLLGRGATVLPEITCACLFDGINEYKLLFYGIEGASRKKNIETLLTLLDTADQLIGFNAVLFDLEFIKQAFEVSEKRMSTWVRKTLDPFMFMKYALQQTSSLAFLLESNKLPSKIGSGTHAITLASEGKFKDLLDYCLMDAKLVYQLCQLSDIKCTGRATLKVDIGSGKWSSLPMIHGESKNNRPHFSDMTQVLPRVDFWNPDVIDWIGRN